MTAFYAAAMFCVFGTMARSALSLGNDYNKGAALAAAFAFWSACIFLVAVA